MILSSLGVIRTEQLVGGLTDDMALSPLKNEFVLLLLSVFREAFVITLLHMVAISRRT